MRRLALGTLSTLLVALVPSAVHASGGDDEIRRSGTCKAGTATWEMRVRWDDDQRLEEGRGGP